MQIKSSLLFATLALTLNPASLFAQKCPGWTKVPLNWNKTLKEFCPWFGADCKAVSSMYEPPNNEMNLDPLYGTYEEFSLINPDRMGSATSGEASTILSARSIKCEQYSPTTQELSEKAAVLKQQKECATAGGKWMGHIQGRGRIFGCNMPTKDTGKACTGKAGECQGTCVNFKCFGWRRYKGCGVVRDDGKSWCVE